MMKRNKEKNNSQKEKEGGGENWIDLPDLFTKFYSSKNTNFTTHATS